MLDSVYYMTLKRNLKCFRRETLRFCHNVHNVVMDIIM